MDLGGGEGGGTSREQELLDIFLKCFISCCAVVIIPVLVLERKDKGSGNEKDRNEDDQEEIPSFWPGDTVIWPADQQKDAGLLVPLEDDVP